MLLLYSEATAVMYSNTNSWYSQPTTASGSNGASWVQEAGYQTDRAGTVPMSCIFMSFLAELVRCYY